MHNKVNLDRLTGGFERQICTYCASYRSKKFWLAASFQTINITQHNDHFLQFLAVKKYLNKLSLSPVNPKFMMEISWWNTTINLLIFRNMFDFEFLGLRRLDKTALLLVDLQVLLRSISNPSGGSIENPSSFTLMNLMKTQWKDAKDQLTRLNERVRLKAMWRMMVLVGIASVCVLHISQWPRLV